MAAGITNKLHIFIPVEGEARHLCDDCCPADGDGGHSEGRTPGFGDDNCEVCGCPDWEPDEEEEEED